MPQPVPRWLEAAAQLVAHRNGSLAAAIGRAMDRRRLGDNATFALTIDEQLRVNAVLPDRRGAHDPD